MRTAISPGQCSAMNSCFALVWMCWSSVAGHVWEYPDSQSLFWSRPAIFWPFLLLLFLAFFPTDLGGKTADAYPMEWRAHVTNNIFMTLYKTSNASHGGEIFYHVGYITPGHVAVFGRATLSAPGAKKRRGYTKSLVVGTTQEFFVQESRGW